jgi:hypothetical protein
VVQVVRAGSLVVVVAVAVDLKMALTAVLAASAAAV